MWVAERRERAGRSEDRSASQGFHPSLFAFFHSRQKVLTVFFFWLPLYDFLCLGATLSTCPCRHQSDEKEVFDGVEFYLPQLAHMVIHVENNDTSSVSTREDSSAL